MAIEKPMPMKAFLDAVEKRLGECSSDELRAILRTMAQQTSPKDRIVFLSKLKPTAASSDVRPADDKALLKDIASVAEELEEAMADPPLENPAYHDSYDSYGYDYDHDREAPEGPYEEFVEPVTELFDRAAAAFDFGNLALARAAYSKLFKLLDLADEYDMRLDPADLSDVEMGEARARYLRAVYETEPLKRRPEVLFEEIEEIMSLMYGSRPMLEDVIQISTKPLPDQEGFLTDWIAFLREQEGKDADAWLREAIRLSQGTPGLEKLARAEGKKRPRAYVDWVAALIQESKPREAMAAAQEALGTLDRDLPVRAAIADQLCAAAKPLNETEALRNGRWEAFDADPTTTRLLDLWELPAQGAEKDRLMKEAAEHVKAHMGRKPRRREMAGQWCDDQEDDLGTDWVDKSTLAHASLLAGDWQAAHQLAKGEKVLGWSGSDNAQGLVVSFFLALLSRKGGEAPAPNVSKQWQWALGMAGWAASDREQYDEDEEGPQEEAQDTGEKRLEQAYANRMQSISLREEEAKEILSWCLDVAQRRTKEIVSNQHRKSYGKAAILVAACAETLRRRGDEKGAEKLVDGVRKRFPRHSAFQAELRAAMP